MKITTNEVRLSYVNVFKPRAAQPGQEEKYSITCLLPKSDVEGYNALMGVIKAVIDDEANGKLKGVAPEAVKHPIHDGDGYTQNGSEYGPECKGHWVFTASCKADRPPAVVDRRVNPIIDQNEMYSGCYGHVAINVFAYNAPGRKGIGFGLNGVQKTRDGEPLGGAFDVNSAFSAIGDDTPFNPFK